MEQVLGMEKDYWVKLTVRSEQEPSWRRRTQTLGSLLIGMSRLLVREGTGKVQSRWTGRHTNLGVQ